MLHWVKMRFDAGKNPLKIGDRFLGSCVVSIYNTHYFASDACNGLEGENGTNYFSGVLLKMREGSWCEV